MGKLTSVERRFALVLLNRLSQSETVAYATKCIEEDNWAGYLAIKPDPKSPTFPDDYLAASLFKKHPGLPLEVNRSDAALSKWLESEQRCSVTNDRFRAGDYPVKLAHLAREFIRDVLGPLDVHLTRLPSLMRHGPGVSLSPAKGGKSKTKGAKTGEPEVFITPGLIHSFRSWWPGPGAPVPRNVSQMQFVPKTAKIDRVIEIQPTGTLYFQLGLGALLRDRLHKRAGVDLDYQADVNRARVRKPDICTIDLSSASDTISFEVVSNLLPPDWVDALALARTPIVELPDGTLFPLAKFSGMGNGFTFELETLIFHAIAFAVTGEKPEVFGDDIIVKREWFNPLCDALSLFGFSVNEDKSFGDGDFYESCGVDVWRGLDCRPFFMYGPSEVTFAWPTSDRQNIRYRTALKAVKTNHPEAPSWSRSRVLETYERMVGGRRKAGKLYGQAITAALKKARNEHRLLIKGMYWAGIANRLHKYATFSSGGTELDGRFYRPFIHARRLAAFYGVKAPLPVGFGDGGVVSPLPESDPNVKPAKAYNRGHWVNNVALVRAADCEALGTSVDGALINALYDPDDTYRRGAGCPELSLECLDGSRKGKIVTSLFSGALRTGDRKLKQLTRWGVFAEASTTTKWTRGFEFKRSEGVAQTARVFVPEWENMPWWL